MVGKFPLRGLNKHGQENFSVLPAARVYSCTSFDFDFDCQLTFYTCRLPFIYILPALLPTHIEVIKNYGLGGEAELNLLISALFKRVIYVFSWHF